MAVDDSGERGRQIGNWIDSVELACLDKRGDGRPVLCSGVVPGEESVLAVEGYRGAGTAVTVKRSSQVPDASLRLDQTVVERARDASQVPPLRQVCSQKTMHAPATSMS
jgi:hypothetical protein